MKSTEQRCLHSAKHSPCTIGRRLLERRPVHARRVHACGVPDSDVPDGGARAAGLPQRRARAGRAQHRRVRARRGDQDHQQRQRDRHRRGPIRTKAVSLMTRNIWPPIVVAVVTDAPLRGATRGSMPGARRPRAFVSHRAPHARGVPGRNPGRASTRARSEPRAGPRRLRPGRRVCAG